MSHSCAQWRGDIGAYIVGALGSSARDRIARHLAACAGCRADYDELVPVRDSLNLLALATGRPDSGAALRHGHALRNSFQADLVPAIGLEALPPRTRLAPGTEFPAQPADTPPANRLWTRRRLMTAGAAAAAAAAAAAVAVLVSSGAPARTYNAADKATGVSGHAQLVGTPSGTRIDLTATGLPDGERCVLVAVANDRREIAGGWDTTHYGSARMTGTTAFLADQLTALRIESGTGLLLLNIRV